MTLHLSQAEAGAYNELLEANNAQRVRAHLSAKRRARTPGEIRHFMESIQPNSRSGKHGASVPSGPALTNKPALIVACFAGFGIWVVLILLFRWAIALLNRILGG